MSFIKISELPMLNQTALPLTAGDIMPIVHGPTTYKVELSTLNDYFVKPLSAAGTEQQVQFNAHGYLSADAAFTYNFDLSSLSVGGPHIVTGYESAAIGGGFNTVIGNNSLALGGVDNYVAHDNTIVIGTGLSSISAEFTYVNNLSVQKNAVVAGGTVLNSVTSNNFYALNQAGVGTVEPNTELTVIGNVSATGGVYYNEARPNLIYVSKGGDDGNVGTNPSQPFKTIKKACQYISQNQGLIFPVTNTIGQAVKQYTIFVMTGDYTEDNPIYVPQQTTIIGDSLRRTTIRPKNKKHDILWLNAACYVWGFTFRDHLEPSAATAFPNLDQTKQQFHIAFNTPGYEIANVYNDYYRTQKPYINTSPYTQGNSSITSSISAPQSSYTQTISSIPSFNNTASARVDTEFDSLVAITLGGSSKTPATWPTNLSNVPSDATAAISSLTGNRSTIQSAITSYIYSNYPLLFSNPNYQYPACYRDAGYMLDCIVADLQTGTNARIVEAANVYFVGTLGGAGSPPSTPLPNALIYSDVWQYAYSYTRVNYLNSTPFAANYVQTEFDALTSTLTTGQYTVAINTLATPSYAEKQAAALLEANRTFFQNELSAYIDTTFPGWNYGRTTTAAALTAKQRSYRDAGWFIDAIAYDLKTGTNARILTYANSFYMGKAQSRIPNDEYICAASLNYAKYLASFVIGNSAVQTTPAGCGIRVDGSLARGFLRSFVTDSYTQINEGGIGIHITNNGYAQLVSTFTICCREGIRADNGGTCSINTSNCSFGLSGLVAIGKSPSPVLSGKLSLPVKFNTSVMTVSGLLPKYDSPDFNTYSVPITVPYVGLCFTVDGDPTNTLYIMTSAYLQDSSTYTYDIFLNKPCKADLASLSAVNFYLRSQIATGSHTFEYIGSGNYLAKAVPALGGVANPDDEARGADGGAVYFTSTNHLGNFKVGNDFTIVQETGVIEGRTFQRSILALVTPLTLALE